MSSKKMLISALSVGALAFLTACGGSSGASPSSSAAAFSTSATGELKAWAFDNADDVGKARMKYAEEQMPEVNISLDQTSFDAQKFTTRTAGGDVPDVVQMNRSFVATYAAQDLIQPLDECYAAHGVEADSYFYPAVTSQVKYRDNIWAVPQFYQPAAIIANTDVLKDAGVTAEDIDTSQPEKLLAAIDKAYKEKGGNPSVLGFDPVATGQVELWFLGLGGKLNEEDGTPALDNPENVEVINFLKKIYDAQGGFAKVRSMSDSFDVFGDKNQYVKGQVAAQVNAQWYVNVLSPYAKDINITGIPFKDQDGQPTTAASGTAFVIPAGAKNKDAACKWMLSLVKEEAWIAAGEARAKTLESKSGSINTGLFTGSPGPDEAIRSRFVKTSGNQGFDETIKTYYDVLPHGKSIGSSPAGQTITTELKNAVTSVLLGEKSPDQALKDAQEASVRSFEQFQE